MAAPAPEIQDWTYRDARQRMVGQARGVMPGHRCSPRIDDDGNRIVECDCGWLGNVLGWAEHLDVVVRRALDGESAPA